MNKAQLKILKYLLLILVILWVVISTGSEIIYEFKKNWKVALIMLGFTALGLFLLMD
jgi:hypothetical protein